jgi:hypothetical protein
MNGQTEMMRVVVARRPGGPDVLDIEMRPLPVPAEGHILVRVEAAGVNRPDVLQRMGYYPVPPGASDALGLEVAGEVAARGPNATRHGLGARVMALVPGGGYADYCVVDERNALPIPAGLTAIEAAAIPDLFHRLDQRLRPRRPQSRRDAAGPWRNVRHRHDRDRARQGLRRARHRNGRIGRQGAPMRTAGRRPRRQLPNRGFRPANDHRDRRARR